MYEQTTLKSALFLTRKKELGYLLKHRLFQRFAAPWICKLWQVTYVDGLSTASSLKMTSH